jgi:pimeloyl-ACP methyl ester carboxylesterase
VAIAERLADRGFEVFAIDGPAHGRSAGRVAHPVAFAEALLAVDAVHGPFRAVIGHSMGVSAMLYARTLGLRTDRLVCLAGPLRASAVLERFMDVMGLEQPTRERFVALVERLVRQPSSLLDLDRLAPHLGVPGLIVHGTADPDVPWTDSEALAAAWPESDLMLLEGFGHRRILREKAVLDRIEAFLEIA